MFRLKIVILETGSQPSPAQCAFLLLLKFPSFFVYTHHSSGNGSSGRTRKTQGVGSGWAGSGVVAGSVLAPFTQFLLGTTVARPEGGSWSPPPPHLPVLSRLCPWAVQDRRGKCREYVLCSPKCPRHASRVTG